MFFVVFPAGVDYRARRYPVVTFTLIGLNVLVYLVTLAVRLNGGSAVDPWIYEHFWLIPAQSTWYTYLTSLFMHSGLTHLVFNMLYLFLFGACVEDLIGRTKFTVLYLLGGLIASLTYIAAAPGHFTSRIPVGGASGAIMACIGGFLLFLARTKVEFKWVFVLLFFFVFRVFSGSFFLPAWLVISFFFGGDLLGEVLTLGGVVSSSVAFAAHLGGFLWGLGAISLEKQWQTRLEPAKEAPDASLRLPHAAPATNETGTIYLFVNDAQAGPFTLTQVHEMLALGSIPADAHYWQEGMTEWRGVADLQNPTTG